MDRKVYPKGSSLRKKFFDTVKDYPNFEVVQEGNVSQIRIDGEDYFLFFKCVSPEGKPHPIEHQRAQLPRRTEFDDVLKTDIPFLFLGYDVDNDVFVCWEPAKLRNRLNKKSYVSFYSRLSIQESVVEGEIKEETLSNGDKFVLFKRVDIIPFFQTIDEHFPELSKTSENILKEDPLQYGKKVGKDLIGKLSKLEDDESVKLIVDELSDNNADRFTIISKCMNQFGTFYNKMTLTDWLNIVYKYLDKAENNL